jgi:hypothetical protein
LKGEESELASSGYFSFEAYGAIAGIALEANNRDQYRRCVLAATDVLNKHPDDGYNTLDLLKLCARAKDTDGFNNALPHLRHELVNRAKWSRPDIQGLADAATLCVQIGNKLGYQSAIAEAEKDLLLPDEESTTNAETKAENVRQRARGYVFAAGAHARAGDVASVKRDIDTSRQLKDLVGEDWDEPFWFVCKGYVDAGLFDDAVAAIGAAKADKYGMFPTYISHREADVGRFDDAWKMTGRIPTKMRINLEYCLIIQQVHAGQSATISTRLMRQKHLTSAQ